MIKNRYPLIEEVFTPWTAPELFELIKDRPYSFFLDSGMDPQRLGRYDVLTPEAVLQELRLQDGYYKVGFVDGIAMLLRTESFDPADSAYDGRIGGGSRRGAVWRITGSRRAR